jgi:excisionase family DNA binding protein
VQAITTADNKRSGMQAEKIAREWVTYKQAEEVSGLSRTTLWKLLSAGEIKAARVGRAVRLRPQEPHGKAQYSRHAYKVATVHACSGR